MRNIKYFTSDTIEELPWPETEEGVYAKKFLLPLIKDGPTNFVDNAHTNMGVLLMDDVVLPLTVNYTSYPQNPLLETQATSVASPSYICSPSSQYVGFGAEIYGKKNRLFKTCFATLDKLFQWAKLDKVVMVNNWLFATNLYPELTFEQVKTISHFLRERFPNYTILFRSVNPAYDLKLYLSLRKLGFSMSVNRAVYISEDFEAIFQSRMFKSDLKILKSSPYQILENDNIQENQFQRLVDLYRYLYIDKYSKFNPQFNKKFIELLLRTKTLHFKALEKDGKIDAVMGYFIRRNVITSPLFGYDTTLPQELGLYRQISTLLALEAKERNCLLNHSSGAGSYKKLRRAKPVLEYIAIDTKTAPLRQKAVWSLMKNMMNLFAESFMNKIDL